MQYQGRPEVIQICVVLPASLPAVCPAGQPANSIENAFSITRLQASMSLNCFSCDFA